MRPPAILALVIWILVVGGNILQTQTIPPRTFMDGPRLPWFIIFLPIIVIIGAFLKRDLPGESNLGPSVDRLFGQGTYREFMGALRPELMFAAMCLGIVLSALARAFFFKTPVMPPEVMGFFASGGIAFLAAYFIRLRRERA